VLQFTHLLAAVRKDATVVSVKTRWVFSTLADGNIDSIIIFVHPLK
jgi:hypothetical protein